MAESGLTEGGGVHRVVMEFASCLLDIPRTFVFSHCGSVCVLYNNCFTQVT